MLFRWPGKSARPADSILHLGGNDHLRLADAYSGIGIFGTTGSGKTSSTLAQIVLGLHRHPAKPSLLVCPAKKSDLALHQDLHRRAGSKHRFLVFGEGQTFNFVDYLITRAGGVEALLPVLEDLNGLLTRGRTQTQDGFFQPVGIRTGMEAMRATKLAHGVTCPHHARDFVASAASTDDELDDDSRYAVQTLRQLAKVKGDEADRCLNYWAEERIRMGKSEKTLASVDAVAMNLLNQFTGGPVGRCMGGPTSTVTPEMLEQPTVLFLDFPALTGGAPNRLLLAAFMMTVNRYALQRDGGLPIVLIADEFAQFVNPGEDANMAAVLRSHLFGRVLVGQNLPQLAAQLGAGPGGLQEAQSLVANLATVFLHANSCKETNEHFSAVVGEEPVTTTGGTADTGEPFNLAGSLMGTWEPRVSVSFHTQYRRALLPQTFLQLKTGGPANGYEAEAVVLAANRKFGNGLSWKRVSIPQVI